MLMSCSITGTPISEKKLKIHGNKLYLFKRCLLQLYIYCSDVNMMKENSKTSICLEFFPFGLTS